MQVIKASTKLAVQVLQTAPHALQLCERLICRFSSVRKKFNGELRELKLRDQTPYTAQSIISLLMGLKFFRVKVHEISMKFMALPLCYKTGFVWSFKDLGKLKSLFARCWKIGKNGIFGNGLGKFWKFTVMVDIWCAEGGFRRGKNNKKGRPNNGWWREIAKFVNLKWPQDRLCVQLSNIMVWKMVFNFYNKFGNFELKCIWTCESMHSFLTYGHVKRHVIMCSEMCVYLSVNPWQQLQHWLCSGMCARFVLSCIELHTFIPVWWPWPNFKITKASDSTQAALVYVLYQIEFLIFGRGGQSSCRHSL